MSPDRGAHRTITGTAALVANSLFEIGAAFLFTILLARGLGAGGSPISTSGLRPAQCGWPAPSEIVRTVGALPGLADRTAESWRMTAAPRADAGIMAPERVS
jgi:hypothetical protein